MTNCLKLRIFWYLLLKNKKKSAFVNEYINKKFCSLFLINNHFFPHIFYKTASDMQMIYSFSIILFSFCISGMELLFNFIKKDYTPKGILTKNQKIDLKSRG